MEIYTNDLVDLVAKYAEKENEYRDKKGDYAINDLLHDMQIETRRILYDRLSESFKLLIENTKGKDIELSDLCKIINEL